MTSSTPRPEQWEVWIAYVRFADNPSKGKVRPVLAYNEDGDAYLCFKITSKIGDTPFKSIILDDWKSLGLVKQSRLQLEPQYRISKSEFGARIGKASSELASRIDAEFRKLNDSTPS